jgi:hypothetical protein
MLWGAPVTNLANFVVKPKDITGRFPERLVKLWGRDISIAKEEFFPINNLRLINDVAVWKISLHRLWIDASSKPGKGSFKIARKFFLKIPEIAPPRLLKTRAKDH